MSESTTLDIPEIPAIRRRKSDFHSRGGAPVLSLVTDADPHLEERSAGDAARTQALQGVSPNLIKYDLAEAQALLRRVWAAYAKCYTDKKVLEKYAGDRILQHMNATASASSSEIEAARQQMDVAIANATLSRDNLEKVRGHVESVSREVTRLGVLAAISDELGSSVSPEIAEEIEKLKLLI